ncbi:protein of unknown function [Bradyrhizobium vignae]|uniref:Uncharacterized protein n=1 Tax=Bradyrhizobium vignae TaxID=1549949 RepID=A0A2U3PVC0_9BRAD|nr:protein of unknown function [Bradyrhizobium vignae]
MPAARNHEAHYGRQFDNPCCDVNNLKDTTEYRACPEECGVSLAAVRMQWDQIPKWGCPV